ncbi:hypothetical protein AJ79_04817 [Helicocarpus griseus UAMH5409]|uniref:Cell wall proline rich protein n=1 Tax=Helicocarpus griseus UAMH5409 TaxID=1447875 RepID=A0A2B7XRH5_9EURO|nr:hypothetical protein AJ79_04817 [Helicocarpus griseus UAMH5409]
MASISLSSVQAQQLHLDSSRPSYERQNHLRLSMTAPVPNPPFVFPQRDPPSPSPDTASPRCSPPPLPSFSFPQAPDPAASATPSPTTPHLRPIGHRRRPSELNGSESIPALGSPASENVLPTQTPPGGPGLPAPGPGLSGNAPRRRGHSHRRSAAISSMDLTAVAKAFPPMPVGGSAPVTPADLKQQHVLNDEAARPSSRSFPNLSPQTPPISSSPGLLSPDVNSHARANVTEPSDTRRPVSTISSNDSTSTVRQSGNKSATSSPGNTLTTDKPQTRPRTAGASFDLKQEPSNPKDENAPQKRPLSASASVGGIKMSSSDVPDLPPFKKSIIEGYEKSSANLMSKDGTASLPKLEPTASDQNRPRTSPERKPSKKPKKMRSWAGILSRKAKKRAKKASKRAPTPPPILTRTNSEIGSMAEINFDEDNVIVLRTPTLPDAPRPVETTEPAKDTSSLESAWKPRSFYEQGTDSDMFSPVIDLDAALGPFNTPEMRSDRGVGSGFSAATKRMYSGGRRGEFVGPEMRYHRRAESAPEMPPFDRSSLGLARFGGTSTLTNPDVFYEEEEDAFLAGNDDKSESEASQITSPVPSNDETKRSSGSDSSATVTHAPSNDSNSKAPGLGIQGAESHNSSVTSEEITGQTLDSRPGTSPLTDSPATPSSVSNGPLGQSQNNPRSEDVEIVEVDDWPIPAERRPILPDKRPSTSPECVYIPKSSIPDVPVPNVNFPLPNISFDAPRLLTASSVTDRHTFHSGYTDHPVDSRHDSVEDVPSLTSSASTTTGTIPRISSNFYTRAPGDRSASFSTATSRRTSRSNGPKRASLVSLSKLVSGSNGEKSKLSYEEKAPHDEAEKTKKKGHHRISRLMHFWKTKEKQKETGK